MRLSQALGLTVLMCLTASTVNGAESKKQTEEEQQRAEQQRQAEEAARQVEAMKKEAEAMKQQAETELKDAERKREEIEDQQRQAERQMKDLQEAQAKKESEESGPSLNLPIRYYVYTAIFSGLGYATGFLSRGPERDLRDPAKHPTQDKTLSLYRRAHYGGLLSKGFYSVSGAFGAYAAYKTQSSVRAYFTAKAQQAAQQSRQSAALQSPEERQAIELSNSLLLPPETVVLEPLAIPEPPPLQAGFFLSPSGDASVSLSVTF